MYVLYDRKNMNIEETKYLELLKEIMDHGEDREDRTGIGTRSVFGRSLRFNLENDTLPLITTKKVFFKGVVEELLFFLRGHSNTKILEERGVKIWKGNTSREFLDSRGLTHLPEGNMGKGYGYQWRYFGSTTTDEGSAIHGVDQIADVLKSLKEDPFSRRHLVSAWNPQQLKEMALPPCHYSFQFYVSKNKELSCLINQRSGDAFLGIVFNFASYALLTHIFAKALGYKAKELIWNGGDIHIYKNHFAAVKEQIEREPNPFPIIKIHKEIESLIDIEQLEFKDFELLDYKHHPSIKADMAV